MSKYMLNSCKIYNILYLILKIFKNSKLLKILNCVILKLFQIEKSNLLEHVNVLGKSTFL